MGTGRLNRWVILAAIPLAVALSQGYGRADSFSAGLVRCADVTQPAKLTGCGTDPLGHGEATINDVGDVYVAVRQAAPGTTYAVAFQSSDGSKSAAIANLVTDSHGNGLLHKETFFAPVGTVGAGNVVLTNGGVEEFISGIAIPSIAGESNPGLEPSLVRCADVKVPAAPVNCGTDTLKGGRVDIEGDDGDLTIQVRGAAVSSTYTAVLLSPAGASTTLPTVTTDKSGNGIAAASAEFLPGSVSTGTVILSRAGSSQFLSGFRVTHKPIPPTVSQASLVRCADLTEPVLTTCGTDPLSVGAVQVNAQGLVKISVQGAGASVSYELFFRPVDNSGDTDTTLSLTTDQNGNKAGSISFFKSGTVASGNFVLKRAGSDQYVTGFAIR